MASTWVVTGSGGQLGRALVRALSADPERELLAAPRHAECDVADPEAVRALLRGLPRPPDVVVNAAAFTHVDRCEREPEIARRVNAEAPGHLARACAEVGAQLAHVSTDYVFPGDVDRPYREDDPTGPRSVYGQTKLEGEERVRAVSPDFLVLRTSWVFGEGRNFVRAILHQAERRRRGEAEGPLRVVDDQRGRPTWADDLAHALRALLEAGAGGVYHWANDGIATWWDLARASLDASGFADLEVERIRTAELDVAAPRPAWSVLDLGKARALGVGSRPWPEALRAYLAAGDAGPKG